MKIGEGEAPNGACEESVALTFSEAHNQKHVHSTMRVLRAGGGEVIQTLAIVEKLASGVSHRSYWER